LSKTNKGVDVVGHDHVAKDIMPFALQVIKPLIHFIIGIGNLEQPQSTTTGNRDEVNAAIFSYLPANGHVGKLAFYVLRLSLAQEFPKSDYSGKSDPLIPGMV
jgi:hypothetical protein